MPNITCAPGVTASRQRVASTSPNGSSITVPAARVRTVPGTRFIGGAPTIVATKLSAGRSYSSAGVPVCTMRPSRSTAIRSPMVSASSWSGVAYTMVMPSSRCRRLNSARVSWRSLASRLVSGSSRRSSLGRRTSARPIARRCCSPPDSVFGLRASVWLMPSISAISATRARISVGARPLSRKG